MTRFAIVSVWALAVAVTLPVPNVQGADRPNFLVIMADDCTHNDLPLYGGQNAKTPNIDRLATQGLTFTNAYLAEAMCQPCRAELFSGRFPMRNGCAWNHSASLPTLTTMPQHLSALGYRVGIAGKVHVAPTKAFPFEMVGGYDRSCVRNPTQPHDIGEVKSFMSAADDDKPFCLVVALVEPHVPWVMGDASQYPPKKIRLPANLADTPRTRQQFGAYLAEITYMDGQVGELLAALEASGHTKDTVVLFTSEQGSQFPGNKWTNWDTGVHTALVARWPGHVPANKRTDAIVMYADVLPTFVDLAGGDPKTHGYDGTSIKPVLLGQTNKHRSYAYAVHNNIPEGPAYPVRGISDGTYRYIRNLTPDEIYIEKHLMGKQGAGDKDDPYWLSWVAQAWNHPATYNLVRRYQHRPAEELYRTADDPYELTNLAGDPKYAEVQARLGAELDRWLTAQADPGAAQDTHEAHQAARKGEHLYRGPK